ncbi:MAG: hypothetical protein J5669_08140 [Bacteroidales bacterium]|nr:hypothetical protein [Bacteroidales bacterium]
MKIVKFLLVSASIALLAVSCKKESNILTPAEGTPNLTRITCVFPSMTDQDGTKVSLAADGKTGWEEGDEIIIYGQRGTESPAASSNWLLPVRYSLTAGDIGDDPRTASFTVDMSSIIDYPDPEGVGSNRPFNAAYGDNWDYYSDWYSSGRARFYNTNQLLMAGYINNSGEMTLYNLCAAITFKVSGDYDSYYFSGNADETVGYENYLVQMNSGSPSYAVFRDDSYGTQGPLKTISGPVNANGTALNYIFIPNEVSLASGFTITLAKAGKKLKSISSTAELNLAHGHMVNLDLLPSAKMKDVTVFSAAQMESAIDKSENESANCYVINGGDASNASKIFKFRAVKGNSYVKGSSAGESVGSAYIATVLWETWNSTSSGVTARSVIDKVDYYNGYVYFQMPSSLHIGNALIAVKDNEGEILWSWHIWVPGSAYADIDEGFAAEGKKIMDRNLGALYVATTGSTPDYNTHGLYYQWGRKDPFYSDRIKGAPSGAFSTVVSTTTPGTTISHPTVFYYNADKNWCSSDISTLWNDSGKTVYDPCPTGYRVPVYDDSKDLWKKSGTNWTFDTTNKTAKHNNYSSVFPMPGYLNSSSSLWPSDSDGRIIVWSATDNGSYKGKCAYLYNGSYSADLSYKTRGGSVRCVVE